MRIALGLIAAVAVVVVAVLLYAAASLDRLVKQGIETYGSRIVGAPVRVGSVEISLSSGRGTLRELSISNPDGFSSGEALRLGEITLDIQLSSLTQEPLVIQEVKILAPEVKRRGLGKRQHKHRRAATECLDLRGDRLGRETGNRFELGNGGRHPASSAADRRARVCGRQARSRHYRRGRRRPRPGARAAAPLRARGQERAADRCDCEEHPRLLHAQHRQRRREEHGGKSRREAD